MSETATVIERDQKSGRFLPGNSGFGGRPRGSRNKLGEAFLEDLRTVWEEAGIDALRRCAREDAPAFCRIIANLLPKDIDINVTGSIDVGNFAQRFRAAVELLGNEPQPRTKTIEHADSRKRR